MKTCRSGVLLAAAAILAACSPRNEPVATPPPPLDERSQCQQKRDELLEKAGELLAVANPRESLKLLGPCRNFTDDPEFVRLYDGVRAAIAKEDLDAIPPDKPVARLGALQLWKAYAGTIPERYESELKRLEGAEARERKAREAVFAQVGRMDFWELCMEAGRVVRTPAGKRVQPRADVILAKAGFNREEESAVRAREVALGMDECALAASLGRPESINRSVGSFGRHDQWVYRRGKYDYVYTEDGKVRSYQQ